MIKKSLSIVIISWLFMAGCWDSGGSSGDSTSSAGGSSGSGNSGESVELSQVSNAEWENLSSEEQYAVSNKLLGTLYKGLPADEFFDFSTEGGALAKKSNSNYLDEIKSKLSEPVDSLDTYLTAIDEKYSFNSKQQPIQYPLAMLHEFPLSKDYYNMWMAYIVANTILMSPAAELETVDNTDVQDVFYRLLNMISENRSISDIVYEHMISQENWRRFRSPEDNTREMMEIFLGHFNDDDVPLAAKACKNWSLTEESEGYQLVIGYDENTEPIQLLGATVVDCYDFYQAVANHNSLIPNVTLTLLRIFFTTYSDEQKADIVVQVMASNPKTFRELFTLIIFSKEYLFYVERPKVFEETFFNIAPRIKWYAKSNFFKDINNQSTGSNYPSLKNMRQGALIYKLGKPVEIPLDTLSFSYYHKAIRERLMLDRKTDSFNTNDGGWQVEFIEVNMAGDAFIDYLFLSVVSRHATQEELDELNTIISSRGYDKEEKELHKAMIVLDYLSRLSELYYTTSLN